MNLFYVLFFLLAMGLQACASVVSDPRGEFWGLGAERCAVARDGASFCAAKLRLWGQL
jgi:hypothetical protein